jgi:hypothetical protein
MQQMQQPQQQMMGQQKIRCAASALHLLGRHRQPVVFVLTSAEGACFALPRI